MAIQKLSHKEGSNKFFKVLTKMMIILTKLLYATLFCPFVTIYTIFRIILVLVLLTFAFNKIEIIPEGGMGFQAIYRDDHQVVYVSVLAPAKNTITMDTGKISSEADCASWCLTNEQCSFFQYASDTMVCTLINLA